MKYKTHLNASSTLIDLTPLVDVIFLLLIFFMISSDIVPVKALNVEHPTLERDSEQTVAQLLVVMDAQHVLYFGPNKEIVDLEELRTKISEHSVDGATIVLSVDRHVEYGAFLRLFSLAQEMGPTVKLVYETVEG